jgi:choline dehydrogenase-like flavoprotein
MGKREEYDAIVVGSGMSGGWAAKEITERGLRTIVLEAGGLVTPDDYVMDVYPWDLKYRGRRERAVQSLQRPIQSTCYACDAWSEKFFVRDDENPYTTADGTDFSWIRGRQVGGRSIMWGRHVYRWSDLDFEASLKDGHGVDWPIRYADIEPWYDHVERFIGVTGQAEGLAQLPDMQFLPPMTLNCQEQVARDRLTQAYGGERLITIGRCAVLTQPHNGRAACHYCGTCERGCSTHSYFSSLAATLPAVVDKWGIPALRIHCEWSDNERKMLQEMSVQAAEMLDAVGARDVVSFVEDNPPGLTIHEMGTARMASDSETSVLNGWNQAWDVPNLFMTDGACMASSANQNPSITYMALTARAVNHAVDLMDRGEL